MAVVTGFYAALTALLVVVLIGMVAQFRRTHGVGYAGYDNRELMTLVRAHGNAIETIPVVLILMLIAELDNLPPVWIHAAGVALLLSRIAHAHGYISTRGKYSHGRFYGMMMTLVLMIVLAAVNILMFFGC
jgi:uncharacterized membrane protein YecN with MAPEG domain